MTDITEHPTTAHQCGVIHRDVKPGNILLTPDGRAKLADFGIAKSTETLDHTQTGVIVGTPAYLAPERLEGQPATAQSDLYAIGVVLYEALTGERPFRGDTPIALAHAVHATTPVPIRERLPGVDPALARAVDAAMAKDPGRRPSSAEAMLALVAGEFDSLDDTQSMSATAVLPVHTIFEAQHAPTQSRRWWERRDRRTLSMIGIAGVAVVVAIGLVSSVGDGRDAFPTTTTWVPAAAPPLPAPLDDAIIRLEVGSAVKRLLAVFVLAGVLMGGCGGDPTDVSKSAAAELQPLVAQIRQLAGQRQADQVAAKLAELRPRVSDLVQRGELSARAGQEIVASAEGVQAQLALITTTTAPPPPPRNDKDREEEDEDREEEEDDEED